MNRRPPLGKPYRCARHIVGWLWSSSSVAERKLRFTKFWVVAMARTKRVRKNFLFTFTFHAIHATLFGEQTLIRLIISEINASICFILLEELMRPFHRSYDIVRYSSK